MATADQKNPVGDLTSEFSQATARLLRQELSAMAADLARQGRQVGVGAGLLGGAGVLGLGSFGALTAALMAALDRRPARGAFLVAAIYGAGAGALADAGVKRLTGTDQAGDASDADAEPAATRAPGKAAGKARQGATTAAKATKAKIPAKATPRG
jgi:putative superfamily III holin-X